MRRRLAAAEQAAESRRQSLLAEKAKAQNALGQLAIAREKVRWSRNNALCTKGSWSLPSKRSIGCCSATPIRAHHKVSKAACQCACQVGIT